MEAFIGVITNIRFSHFEKCSDCNGSGAKAGTAAKTCPDCGGSGTVRVNQRTPLGVFQPPKTCDRCGGKGKVIDNPCPTCSGQGRVKKTLSKEIEIPAGIDAGQTLKVSGAGDCGINGGANGDLNVRISVKDDPIFEREGYDVYTEIPISYMQATLGDEITVPTVDGKVRYKVPEGTQTGTVFRLKGKGIKRLYRNERGDHYVTVKVEIPKNLSKKQAELLKAFDASLEDRNTATSKNFFEKMKDFLKD